MKKEPFLFTATFLMDGSIGVIGLCVPLLALRLGATYDQLGILGAASSFTYAFGCLAYGRLSHRVGYQRSTAYACLAVALSLLAYPWVTGISSLIALYSATWLLMSGYWPALQAWLGEGKEPGDLLRTLGKFNISWASGILVGPAIGGVLFVDDLFLPFAVTAGLMGLLACGLYGFRFRPPTVGASSTSVMEHPAAPVFLHIAWVANFATFFATGTVRSLFPKLASDLGVAPEPLGWLMAMIGGAQVVIFALVARIDRWQFRLSPLLAAQAIGIAGLLALVVGRTFSVFLLGLLAQGILTGMTFTASIYYSLFSGGHGSRRTGLHEGIVGLGFLLGPLAGGLVAERLGPRSPYPLGIAVILCAMGIQVLLHRSGLRRVRERTCRESKALARGEA